MFLLLDGIPLPDQRHRPIVHFLFNFVLFYISISRVKNSSAP